MRIILLLALSCSLTASKTKSELHALYCSLDPLSLAQNFAFYELYPESEEGKEALKRAWSILNYKNAEHFDLTLPPLDLRPIVALVNKENFDPPRLTKKQLELIQKIAKGFPNRKLKGYKVKKESDLLLLPPKEIDICRALFLAQQEDSSSYEATIDLMALQILARLKPGASDVEKIDAINEFIFHEMHFRFPPHSLWAKDIDVYTFLPSVIDSRKGVCLGVSILYLCIAQRLDLPLEIVTPPGHIYVRYREKDGNIINIETTARGIDTPSEVYLGIETKSLQMRNPKEVVGLAFINQASVFWGKKDYSKAIELYEIAEKYLPNDPLLKEFLGYNYLFVGSVDKGVKYLKEIKDHIPEFAITKNSVAEDFLNNKVDIEGLKTIFLSVDETRESIIEKRTALEKCLQKFPEFRAGLFQLAGTWLQLGREKEAKKILERYLQIDPDEPTANYYMSVICLQRFNYLDSWKYFKKAEKILKANNHFPRALKELKQALTQACPPNSF
ncbi:MAG: hypothetical protein COT84_03530 [Chlamydiae bacterium CG10_big_fil_rev_8_21_14_0_10_35_9]|nr:MAG: hypothetical protein COT84_03530 [Chlamydiae bacterium CG10_big_fil_rev_8_21_14_0_10_35_9]